jgi:hypothetical protein
MALFITNHLKQIYNLPKLNYLVTVKIRVCTGIYIYMRALIIILSSTLKIRSQKQRTDNLYENIQRSPKITRKSKLNRKSVHQY